jgi:hypothetical protein
VGNEWKWFTLDRRLVGPQSWCCHGGGEKNSPCLCREFNTGHPLHSTVTILTELSHLPLPAQFSPWRHRISHSTRQTGCFIIPRALLISPKADLVLSRRRTQPAAGAHPGERLRRAGYVARLNICAPYPELEAGSEAWTIAESRCRSGASEKFCTVSIKTYTPK